MPGTIIIRNGRIVELPADEEETRINAGIAADPENPELGDEFFKNARPAAEVLPPEVYQALIAKRRSE